MGCKSSLVVYKALHMPVFPPGIILIITHKIPTQLVKEIVSGACCMR
jgi:hypothetical protein